MRILSILFLLIIVSASTCKKREACVGSSGKNFTFKNESAETVNIQLYWDYPDTTIGEFNTLYSSPLAPGGFFEFRMDSYGSCWEENFSETQLEFQFVHVFSRDSLQALPWEEIRANWNGVHLYKFSLSDIQNKEVTVTHK